MTAPTALLRSALEGAVRVARDGEAADPPRPAPPALKRFLRFARLPAPALDIARKVLDEDEAFRQIVAAELRENEVGEAGWLWLTRPDGWEARVEQLRQRAAEADHQEREERAERDAQRRLTYAEDRARRAEALLAVRAEELDQARAELARERGRAESAVEELGALDHQLQELRNQRQQAIRRLKEVEADLARRSAELRQARHEIRMREAELTAPAPPAPAAPVAPAPVAPAPSPALAPGGRQAELAATIARAAAAAQQLSAALASASSLLEPPAQAPDAPASPPPPAVPELAGRARPRVPLRLPPGVLDDSPEAAEHLLRAEGALLLVDGYNVSKEAWPTLPIAVQRTRLVDSLAALHARCGAEVEVVFDGAEGTTTVSGGARAPVRVRFSPESVEADDVLLELVAGTPSHRPIVVATSDRRVRDGARRRGANLLTSAQLLVALRR